MSGPGPTGDIVIAAAPRRRLGVVFWISTGWLAVVVTAAIAADLLPIRDPIEPDFLHRLAPPGREFWLGSDELGRDILSRVIFGARISITVGLLVPLIALSLGLALGLIAGYFRGWLEHVILFYVNVMLAFPGIVALLAIIAYAGADLVNLVLVLGFLGATGATRIARANTLVFAERDFVTAAKALGQSDFGIIVSELLPNVAVPLFSLGLFIVSGTIVFEGILSFLGLSVPPPEPTWGNMIAQGLSALATAPWVWLMPAAVLFLTVLSLNLIGDVVRAIYDPRDSML